MISETDNLEILRVDLAQRSFWNIGYFFSGFIFWMFVEVVGVYQSLEVAKIYWLVGTFFIFPVAVISSKVIGADPFTKGNRLADLVGYTHMSVISLSLPIVFALFLYYPEAMLLAMAILYCLDFYVMSWAFDSPLFGLHALLRVVAVSIVWFAFPLWRIFLIPLIVCCAYLVTIILIPLLRSNWLKTREAGI